MSRNWFLIGELRQAAESAGALASSAPDWEDDVDAFRITNKSEIDAWIERCKVDRPHRFALQSDHDIALAQSGFIDGNLTAQSKLYLAVGEHRFAELKKMYANGQPEAVKKKVGSTDHSKNPWSNHPDNLDERGRYSAKALTKQGQLVKSIGEVKAAGIAAAVGSKLGDTGPNKRRAA